jgi:hypothetical protein
MQEFRMQNAEYILNLHEDFVTGIKRELINSGFKARY